MSTRLVFRNTERKPAVRLTMELEQRIRQLLAEGRSQNAVARAVGCSQHLVHKIASGKVAAVSTVSQG